MQGEATSTDKGQLNFGTSGKIVVLCGMTLSSYGLFALGPVLPAIAAAFPNEPNAAMLTRLLVSSMGILVAILSPIIGAVADRVGPRRTLLASLLVYAIAGSMPYFLNDLFAILMVRMVHGAAVAAWGTVVLVTLVRNSTGNARDRWLGYLAMAATVFSILHTPLVGYIGHAFGWRMVFLTYLIALPVFVLALFGFAPEPPPSTATPAQSGPGGRAFALGTPVTYLIFAFLASAPLMASSVFIPFRLKEIGITDPQAIGNMMLTISAPSAVAGLIYGWIRARHSMQATFVLAFSIMALGMVLVAAVETTNQMIVAMIILGFGQGVGIPNYWSFSAAVGPEEYRARTMGFAKSAIYGGSLMSQLLLEPVVARTNYAFAFAMLASACVALVVFFAWRIIGRRAVPV